MIFKPAEVGWRLGRAYEPRGGGLWVPWDRTTGVIGPQGTVHPEVSDVMPCKGVPPLMIVCRCSARSRSFVRWGAAS
jgi:hypothetical protein